MDYNDEDGGPEHSAIQSILDMLDDKGGELMRAKHGPKEEHPAGGHVVTVEIKPHGGAPEGSKEHEGDESLSEEMLEQLLGDEDEGAEKE
jgi:hypothetical protein